MNDAAGTEIENGTARQQVAQDKPHFLTRFLQLGNKRSGLIRYPKKVIKTYCLFLFEMASKLAVLFLVLLALLLAANFFLNPNLPFRKVKDGWRFVSAENENTVEIGWNARPWESSTLDLNVATGEWGGSTAWSMGPDDGTYQSIGQVCFNLTTMGGPPPSHLSPAQRVAIKKWAESLPPSEWAWPDHLRLIIAVNVDGTESIHQYTRSEMVAATAPLSKILGWELLQNLQ